MAKKEETKFKAEDQIQLKKVHETIDQPDKFAEVFCKAAESQVSIKEIFTKEILKSISTDVNCKNALKEIIRQVEKEDIMIFGKKIGLAVWSIIMLVVGAIISKYIQ